MRSGSDTWYDSLASRGAPDPGNMESAVRWDAWLLCSQDCNDDPETEEQMGGKKLNV